MIGILLALLAVAPAPQDDAFVRSTVELPAELSGRGFYDVNADGRSDLVVYTYWTLWVYLQTPDGRFPPEPDRTLRFPAGTTLYSFADLDDDARLDLLAMTSREFRAISLSTGKTIATELPDPRRCIFHGLEYFAPSHYWHFFKNIVGDEGHELLLPSHEGFLVCELLGEHRGRSFTIPYEAEGALAIDPPGLEARLRKTTRVPPVDFLELDERPGAELLFSRGRSLETHSVREDASAPGGGWRIAPGDRLILARPPKGEDPWFDERDLDPEVLRSFSVRDLDGDGHADLYRYDEATHALLFAFGARGTRQLERPDRILRVAGAPTEIRFRDLDGDRLPELILYEEKDYSKPKNAIGLLLGLRARLTIFRNRGGRELFAPHPSWVGSYLIRPSIGSRSGSFDLGLRTIVRLNADLDGDGRNDLCLQPRDRRLRLHRGVAGALFSEERWREIEIPSDGQYKDISSDAHDLDHDGRTDLVLHYRGWDGSPKEKILVLISRL